ncbi:MAG: HTH domain-containing protein, partial [Treponema sp.]|nr:HTH domain-containing protein [Treponema sp.]
MKEKSSVLSSKAQVLSLLREKNGEAISGSLIAKEIGISRVAVWKSVQALTDAGYTIETKGTGYLLNPKNEKDYLYPWEFAEREKMFFHFLNTESTMDRAREYAFKGAENGSVFTAEKQSAGRGRHGRTWVSKQGGL